MRLRTICWLTCIVLGIIYTLVVDIHAGAPFIAAAFIITALTDKT